MIKVDNMEIYYGSKVLKSLISFEINEGDSVAIVGASGCGKSSLLNIIGFLDDNYYGMYFYNGLNAKDYSKKQVKLLHEKEVGFLMQNFALIDDESVVKNLKIVRGVTDDEIDGYLSEFGLLELRDQKVYSLSGGEQQRVAFIRVLLQDPKLILVDEPGANLDKVNKLFLLDKIFGLKDKTVLVVTHDRGVANLCDKVVEL
jgi:putative ABC transport system ATP-binding protein